MNDSNSFTDQVITRPFVKVQIAGMKVYTNGADLLVELQSGKTFYMKEHCGDGLAILACSAEPCKYYGALGLYIR